MQEHKNSKALEYKTQKYKNTKDNLQKKKKNTKPKYKILKYMNEVDGLWQFSYSSPPAQHRLPPPRTCPRRLKGELFLEIMCYMCIDAGDTPPRPCGTNLFLNVYLYKYTMLLIGQCFFFCGKQIFVFFPKYFPN